MKKVTIRASNGMRVLVRRKSANTLDAVSYFEYKAGIWIHASQSSKLPSDDFNAVTAAIFQAMRELNAAPKAGVK
jgi:cobyric acid synthase